jgi:hypothetical protein
VSRQPLKEDLQLAAAGQPDFPGALVRYAEVEQLRRPVSIVRWAASATAPSMQPPDTLPAIRPEAVTAKRDPAGRGELPQVSTTVASATSSPSAAHVAAVASTSSSLMPQASFRIGRG